MTFDEFRGMALKGLVVECSTVHERRNTLELFEGLGFKIYPAKKCSGSDIELLEGHGVLHLGSLSFLFDLEDLPLIESRSWYRDKDGYLVSCYFFNGSRRFVRFHRIVMKAKPGQFVDHINKDRADNRKCNLRYCKQVENARNRSIYSTNTSGVTGVYFDKQRNKWVASISYNKKRILIGRFTSKEDAVRARFEKETELFKEFAPQRASLCKHN